MTEAIKLKMGQKTITISTTEQKLSAHAGQTTFWGFLHLRKFRPALASALPHVRTSPNALKVTEIALGFIAGNRERNRATVTRNFPTGRVSRFADMEFLLPEPFSMPEVAKHYERAPDRRV